MSKYSTMHKLKYLGQRLMEVIISDDLEDNAHEEELEYYDG